jgi:hypothetical protein
MSAQAVRNHRSRLLVKCDTFYAMEGKDSQSDRRSRPLYTAIACAGVSWMFIITGFALVWPSTQTVRLSIPLLSDLLPSWVGETFNYAWYGLIMGWSCYWVCFRTYAGTRRRYLILGLLIGLWSSYLFLRFPPLGTYSTLPAVTLLLKWNLPFSTWSIVGVTFALYVSIGLASDYAVTLAKTRHPA